MAARKYRFERLTPIDNMDLNVLDGRKCFQQPLVNSY